ncbi:MAG: radical SAM protein [Syntrophaceae bacterium]
MRPILKIGFVTNLNFNTKNDRYLETIRYIPLGLLSLIAVLEEKGIKSNLLDINALLEKKQIAAGNIMNEILSCIDDDYNILGFSTDCSSLQYTLKTAKYYKLLNKTCTIILGGPQATAVYREILISHQYIDVVVLGEAELIVSDLIKAIADKGKYSRIPGIAYLDVGKLKVNEPAALIDLGKLPMPAFSKIQDIGEMKTIPLDVGRGCPFNCIFCSTNHYWKRKYRLKPINKLIDEIKYINEEYGISRFQFNHDIFTLNKNYIETFCKTLIQDKICITWSCSTRLNCIDKELLTLMNSAGLCTLFVGIETASPRLQRVIKKNLALTYLNDLIMDTKSLNIELILSLIIGLPTETEEETIETMNLALHYAFRKNASTPVNVLTPFAGSEAYRKFELKFNKSFHGNEIIDYESVIQNPKLFSYYYNFACSDCDAEILHHIVSAYSILLNHFRKTVLGLMNQERFSAKDLIRFCKVMTNLQNKATIIKLLETKIENSNSPILAEIFVFEKSVFEMKSNPEIQQVTINLFYPVIQNYADKNLFKVHRFPKPQRITLTREGPRLIANYGTRTT